MPCGGNFPPLAFPAAAPETALVDQSPGTLRAARQRKEARVTRLLAQATTAHRQGRLAEAEPLYRQVLAIDPGPHFDALHMLGVVHAQQSQHPQAIETLRLALQIAPDNATAHCNLGNALRGFRRPLEALANYDRALQIDPGYDMRCAGAAMRCATWTAGGGARQLRRRFTYSAGRCRKRCIIAATFCWSSAACRRR